MVRLCTNYMCEGCGVTAEKREQIMQTSNEARKVTPPTVTLALQ